MAYISGIVIFIVFNGLGFVLLFRAISERRKLQSANTWPSAQGVILASCVEEDDSRNAVGKVAVTFMPVVSYEYTVLGKTYHGTKVTLGTSGFNYIDASNISKRFPEGAQVPVFYNPAKPEEAVLAPRAAGGLFPLTPGIFFIAVGVGIGLYSIFSK
jgi:hypothetical protein